MSRMIGSSAVTTTVWSNAERKTARQTTSRARRPRSAPGLPSIVAPGCAWTGAVSLVAMGASSLTICRQQIRLDGWRLDGDRLVEVREENRAHRLVSVVRGQDAAQYDLVQLAIFFAQADRHRDVTSRVWRAD